MTTCTTVFALEIRSYGRRRYAIEHSGPVVTSFSPLEIAVIDSYSWYRPGTCLAG